MMFGADPFASVPYGSTANLGLATEATLPGGIFRRDDTGRAFTREQTRRDFRRDDTGTDFRQGDRQ